MDAIFNFIIEHDQSAIGEIRKGLGLRYCADSEGAVDLILLNDTDIETYILRINADGTFTRYEGGNIANNFLHEKRSYARCDQFIKEKKEA